MHLKKIDDHIQLTSLRQEPGEKLQPYLLVPDLKGLKKPVIIPPITYAENDENDNASGMTARSLFPCRLFPPGSYRRLQAYPSRLP